MLLAFATHTAAYLGVMAWRAALIARGSAYRFFEHLPTITAYVVFRTGLTCSNPSPPQRYGHQRPQNTPKCLLPAQL
jgi:hypothetical protein